MALLERFSGSNRDPVTIYSLNAVRDVNLNRAPEGEVIVVLQDSTSFKSTPAPRRDLIQA